MKGLERKEEVKKEFLLSEYLRSKIQFRQIRAGKEIQRHHKDMVLALIPLFTTIDSCVELKGIDNHHIPCTYGYRLVIQQ